MAKAHDPRAFLVLAEINRCLLVLDRVRHMRLAQTEKFRCAQDLIGFRDLPVHSGDDVILLRRRILAILMGIEQEVALRDPLETARRRISELVLA
jgi:hypothetical protein